MVTLEVKPRPTPAERGDVSLGIEVEERLADLAGALEEWISHRPEWVLDLVEGTDFDRPNNVEAHIMITSAQQTSTLTLRLDQLDAVDDTGEQLVLRLEERDGIAKLARLTATGLEVELYHVLTFT
jgi:hypothetical protein